MATGTSASTNSQTAVFGTLTKKGEKNKNLVANLEQHRDPRMRFRNSADPIYVAFDYIDSQSIPVLAASFVKESIFEVVNFVSKVTKK